VDEAAVRAFQTDGPAVAIKNFQCSPLSSTNEVSRGTFAHGHGAANETGFKIKPMRDSSIMGKTLALRGFRDK
jgi:hypothetical protein